MSPKTLTGAELDLNDAPARDSELFLVDGNNLAYRAFFALPEELATSEGFPTNALLGFANMLFKLLSDYRPKGVAVAWDTRPVHRAAQAEAADVVYKEGRRPMPDLLREQFPHFRPIVEAFGYRNLEFEGWEADDVIATLATRADEEEIKTCVVSTDRDAFQLVTENVCLMMTPRGVSDVNVYTPERVEARYGIRPEQIPDFIGLKGDTSDNIPGVPGIGDKTAGQLVAQYGSLEGVLEHVDELSPARKKNLTEFAEQARAAKVLATMQRDLDIAADPAELVLAPPDRAQLRETFRQFEFRALLGRVDELDEAVPARERISAGTAVAWREEASNNLLQGHELVGIAADEGRIALALGDEVVVRPRPERLEGTFVAHDAKALRVEAADDTMILAYLIDPARSEYLLDDLAAEYAVEAVAEPEAEEETARLVRHAAVTLRLREPLLERVRERGAEPLYRDVEMPLVERSRPDGEGRRPHRHVPHGRDHGAARRPRRGARVARVRARGRGVRARLAAAARAHPVREARAHARPQGQDRLLDRHEGAALDPRGARDRRRDRGVARALEAPQHVPPAAARDDRRRRPPAHDLQPDRRRDRPPLDVEPEPPVDPDPHRPRPRDPLGVRRRAGRAADLRRLLADRAADPRARLRRAEAARGVRARGGHPHRDGRRGARRRPGEAHVRPSARSRR